MLDVGASSTLEMCELETWSRLEEALTVSQQDGCWMLVPFVFLILVPGIGWGNEFLSRRNTHDGTYSSRMNGSLVPTLREL